MSHACLELGTTLLGLVLVLGQEDVALAWATVVRLLPALFLAWVFLR